MSSQPGALVAGRRAAVTLAERGYRRVAPLYDLLFGAVLQHGRRAAVAALGCAPGERVLEVCVGSGLSLPLYPAGTRVTGLDISREMLEKARARTARRALTQVEALVPMDASRLAFADASFDKAAVMFAVCGLPDPVLALREVSRVCRPGATIVVVNHFKSRRTFLKLIDALLAPVYAILRYRADLELEPLVAALGLRVVDRQSVNLFGYATLVTFCNEPADASPRACASPGLPLP